MDKKTNKVVIISVISLLVILLIGVVLLMPKMAKENSDTIAENNEIEKTEIQNEKYDELKDKLGNGSNGNVIDVKEGKDENNNRTYTFTFKDNSSQTVTIRKAEEGEEINNPSLPIKIDDDQDIGGDDIDDKDDNKEDESDDDIGKYDTAYEDFIHMSSSQQSAFYDSFESMDAFFAWYDAAEAEYNKLHPQIIIGENEVIDFGN